MKLIGGFQNTKTNNEDFAITPYLFGVWVSEKVIKVRGIGVCWGFYSIYIGAGINIPKDYSGFKIITPSNQEK